MKTFSLQIVTPDGIFFDGEAEALTVRTIGGDVGILAGHTDYLTALGMGAAKVKTGDSCRKAACIGGMLSVLGGRVRVVATTFEWAEDIDKARAEASCQKAGELLDHRENYSKEDIALAEARLRRAKVRLGVIA